MKITTAKYYNIPGRSRIQALDYLTEMKIWQCRKKFRDSWFPFNTSGKKGVWWRGILLTQPDWLEPQSWTTSIQSLISKTFSLIMRHVTDVLHPKVLLWIIFELLDSDFNDFVSYISDKDTIILPRRKAMEDLEEQWRRKYFGYTNQADALKNKLAHNKRADVEKNKSEILQLVKRRNHCTILFPKRKNWCQFKNDRIWRMPLMWFGIKSEPCRNWLDHWRQMQEKTIWGSLCNQQGNWDNPFLQFKFHSACNFSPTETV